MLLSVVLSFKNEADVLPALIRRLESSLQGIDWGYELIFVNDASTDASLEVLLRERQSNPRIKIINMSRTFGIAPGILAGLRRARGDGVVYMDADLQDPPELIPALLDKHKEGYDVVHMTRTKRKGESAVKMWLTHCAYRMINVLSSVKIRVNTGDFKFLSRRALDHLLQLSEYDPFMRGLVTWIGFKDTCVLYEREARFSGNTKCSVLRSLKPYKEFVRGLTSFSEAPLYLALYFGLTIALGTFVAVLIVAVRNTLFGYRFSAMTVLMLTVLFLGGAILVTIGILGIYIGKIHLASKNRPNYIVESIVGLECPASNDKTPESTVP